MQQLNYMQLCRESAHDLERVCALTFAPQPRLHVPHGRAGRGTRVAGGTGEALARRPNDNAEPHS